jgi:hypothetical protein
VHRIFGALGKKPQPALRFEIDSQVTGAFGTEQKIGCVRFSICFYSAAQTGSAWERAVRYRTRMHRAHHTQHGGKVSIQGFPVFSFGEAWLRSPRRPLRALVCVLMHTLWTMRTASAIRKPIVPHAPGSRPLPEIVRLHTSIIHNCHP